MDAAQPGFNPRRRATTLLTPSAAITTSASYRRPSRVVSLTHAASSCACTMSAPVMSSAPASTASATSSASNSTRRIISAAVTSDSTTADWPSGPSRCSRDTLWVTIRGSSRPRYGNRRRTRALMPPPHGLLRGNAARSSKRTGIPARARALAAVAPAGPAPTTMTGRGGEELTNTSRNRKNRPVSVKSSHYR